jgi:folate-binding protein YgfZ
VVKISGEAAREFLNGLVTTDMMLLRPGLGRFGALLTPQGKIVVDFLLTEASSAEGGGFLIDCPRALSQALADKLGFYKLRAKVVIENLSDSLGVLAAWDGEPATKLVDSAVYEAHRIALGVPRGGMDFIYGDAFPHETNMDHLHGVDFDKGCYVGQEVVSRMQHRGTARTRTVRVIVDGPSPEPGAIVLAGDKTVGTMGSTAASHGLALVRTDRVADALQAGLPLTSGGIALRLAEADELLRSSKQTVA